MDKNRPPTQSECGICKPAEPHSPWDVVVISIDYVERLVLLKWPIMCRVGR